MRLLHIATHKGNIGDKINHQGFYDILEEITGEIQIDKVELRDFYFSAANRKFFDIDFARTINTYDLCIVGGGGFFDAQWINSSTGVTIDWTREFVEEISIPVIINAMGYHEYPGFTNQIIKDKFMKFLMLITSKKNWLITVRNDGSYERLSKTYGDKTIRKVIKVVDNGFFCAFDKAEELKSTEIFIGMCISNDLFSLEYNKEVDTYNFNKSIGKFICQQIELNRKVVLFPHTPADIDVIGKVISDIPDNIKRNYIIIAPYDANTDFAVKQLGNYYRVCKCVIGMRFHSLITAINLKIPAISLAGHAQIESLYYDLGLENMCIKLDDINFINRLNKLVDCCMNDSKGMQNRYEKIYDNYLKIMKEKYKVCIKELIFDIK